MGNSQATSKKVYIGNDCPTAWEQKGSHMCIIQKIDKFVYC